MRPRTSAVATRALSLALSLATISLGVFAGAIIPCHAARSKPGTPACASGGTLGSAARRAVVVTAIGAQLSGGDKIGSAGPKIGEHELDISGDQIVQRRRRAVIGHVRHLDARHVGKHGGGQMMEGANAAGAVSSAAVVWRAQ